MAMMNKAFSDAEVASNNYEDGNSPEKVTADFRIRSSTSFFQKTISGKILLGVATLLFFVCIALIVLLAVGKNKDSDNAAKSNKTNEDTYSYSVEANRVGLPEFLEKVRKTYYEYNRDNLPWQAFKTTEEIVDDLKNRHLPYNATPAYLKAKTDAALSLLKEIQEKDTDENKLKPRELKALEQVKHFLGTVFGNPFDENFYNGDWMLGPNHFCWQPICSIAYSINAYAFYVRPSNLEELDSVLKKIMLNRESLLQYKSNMKLGVRTGMVRSKFTCQSGLDAFKQEFKEISKQNNPNDVLKEWFVKIYIQEDFTNKIPAADQQTWFKKNKESTSSSISEALVEGIGKPVVELIDYLENDHMKHCLSKDVSSGMGSLPVDFIYVNGKPTSKRTTKTLPMTNIRLNGKESYRSILPYFTTSDISPERINEIGKERLSMLYPQVLTVAKNITGESNETEAVAKFRNLLKQQMQFYNEAPFPSNESNAAAHKNCTDPESAERYCPKRWEAMVKWADTCRQTMGMLAPKLIPLFYHTGKKITVPNCPIEMLPSFNPSSGAQFFRGTKSNCIKPAYFGLPFFLGNYGPKFSEWSVTAHEAWPGHHTQVQAQVEYFEDKYGGVPKWIDDQTYYTFFTEGWGLYSEKPVIADDTDTYKKNALQKYGMLKWQIWRALRLIVDTGLHYRGMNRSTALEYFSKYAWDDTDLAEKEITRYMGVPGQATAYMLGQQKLIQLRNYTKSKLGEKFSIQDFHYQILSHGSAPEAFIEKHVEKYVNCSLGNLKGEQCDVILNPPKRTGKSDRRTEREGPPKPPKRHYL